MLSRLATPLAGPGGYTKQFATDPTRSRRRDLLRDAERPSDTAVFPPLIMSNFLITSNF